MAISIQWKNWKMWKNVTIFYESKINPIIIVD